MNEETTPPKAYSLDEFLDLEFETPTHIGSAEFVSEIKVIRLYGIGFQNLGYFEIDTERGTLQKWLEHLCRKNWITSEMIGNVVRIWFLHVGNK